MSSWAQPGEKSRICSWFIIFLFLIRLSYVLDILSIEDAWKRCLSDQICQDSVIYARDIPISGFS